MTTGEIVEQSKEYIKKNIERSLTVAEVAGAVGYSEYYFSRLFKNETRTSVMEYVKREKLQRASVEIRSGKKIMDAALKYGWESHNGFTKAFKKEFGYCPALLRAMVISMQRLGGKSMGRTVNGRVDEHATKEQLFEILKKKVIQMYPSVDEKEIQYIYEYACEIYHGMERYSGDEYITHPLHTAILLADMETEYHTICAGLFCDVMQKRLVDRKELKKHLAEEVVELVVGAGKEDLETREERKEQIVLIRLATRLHNMRTIDYMDGQQRKRRAEETCEIFVPLAEKTGNYEIAKELRELSMRV